MSLSAEKENILNTWDPEPDNKRDPDHFVFQGLLKNFWAGVALEVRNNGFSVVPVDLVRGVFENALDQAPSTLELDEIARNRFGLRANLDKVRRKIVFRTKFAGYEMNEEERRHFVAVTTKVCDMCGYISNDHPKDLASEWLRVLCNGDLVRGDLGTGDLHLLKQDED